MNTATKAHPANADANVIDEAAARERCRKLRRRILDVSQRVSALHIGGAFSCLEIVDAVYRALMRRTPGGSYRDTFILSKGHGALAQYAVLEQLGLLAPRYLDAFCKREGSLGTHPEYGSPGIEASTGSLGHGLGLAIGMALADRVLREDRLIYLVMSDGELQEGSVWEAMMLAPSFHVRNLIAFVDLNDFQSLGRTSHTFPNFYPIETKARAFGWETAEVDGHDSQAICDAVLSRRGELPFFVIAHTVKGKGISYMENRAIWHYRSPSPEEYQQALCELAEDTTDA